MAHTYSFKYESIDGEPISQILLELVYQNWINVRYGSQNDLYEGNRQFPQKLAIIITHSDIESSL